MISKIAVFFDLQGTLGGEGLGDIRDFTLFPFSALAIKLINKAGLLAVIITNQSHIAKGYFNYQFFQERMADIQQEMEESGGRVDAVYCCPHGEEGNCTCKKPRPGLVLAAKNDFNLDLAKSYVVGDSGAWDMTLAQTIGSKKILVRTGLGESSLAEYRSTWAGINADCIANNVLDAAKWILADIAANNPGN
jgi:D-glycero-D-manno-heptose 1,7-bisphosphate phosphatase